MSIQNSYKLRTAGMEPWTDGAPLVLNQNSYKLRTPGMEPWTDGAPLMLKSELLRNLKFEDGALD